MRRVLLLSALPLSTGFFGVAYAQTTISDERTEPLTTSVDGDITIDENGELNILNRGESAITIDSDNNISVDGAIDVSGNEDNFSAILISGNRTADLDIAGSILIDSDAAVQNEIPEAYPQGRFGVLLATGGQLTGNITFDDSTVVGIETDAGAAVGLQGALNGDLTINGDLLIVGDDSSLVDVQDISGDLTLEAASVLRTEGVRSNGVVVNGQIGGAFRHSGLLNVSGFTDLAPDNTGDATDNDDFQETRPSGNGISFFGDVAGGVLIDGIVGSADDDPDNPDASPGQGFSSTVQVSGGGVALNIVGSGATPLTIGAITNEVGLRADYGTWSIENRGVVSSEGLYDGFSAEAVVLRNVDLVGGFRNSGSLTAIGTTEFSTAVGFYDTTLPELFNTGNITANVNEGSSAALGIYIDADSSLTTLNNNRTISVRSDTGMAAAILDESGTLTSLTNTGAITAVTANTDPADNTIFAVDLRSNTSGVVFENTIPDEIIDENGALLAPRTDFGFVIGDIGFGSGDDQLSFDAGFLTGDVDFGAGDNTFRVSDGTSVTGDVDFGAGFNQLLGNNARITGDLNFGAGSGILSLSNGSEFTGTILSADNIDIAFDASTITLSDDTNTNASSIAVGNGSSLFFSLSEDGSTISTLNVTGTFSVDDTSTIDVLYSGLVDEELQAPIVSAGQLNVSTEALTAGLSESGSFIVDEQFSIDAANPNDLLLTLTLRSEEDLGINSNVAGIYQPTLAALQSDTSLSSEFFNLSTEDEFNTAFDQLLPASLDMSLRAAELQSNAVSSLTSTRSNLLLHNDQTSDGVVWAQQQFSLLNRDDTRDVQAYRGQSYTLALGIDKPLLGLDVLGTAVAISSSSLDEFEQEDLPNTRVVWDFSTYAAKRIGPIALDGRFGYGLVQNSSERRVEIGDESREFSAKWEGTQLSGFARAQIPLSVGPVAVIPTTSLDWVSLTDDEYAERIENADVSDLAIVADEREASSMYLNTGLTIDFRGKTGAGDGPDRRSQNRGFNRPRVGGNGTGGFAISGGYSHPLNDDQLSATYAYQSGENFELLSDQLEGRFYGGADFNYNDDIFVFSAGVYTQFDDVSQAVSGRLSLGVRW